MFRTEHELELPMGYLDADGTLHREVEPLKDARVQRNPAYLTVILLARVVTRLGTLDVITPKTIEGLFAADLAYLQDLYNTINGGETMPVTCPACDHAFEVGHVPVGGS
jgi:hypothetical protein